MDEVVDTICRKRPIILENIKIDESHISWNGNMEQNVRVIGEKSKGYKIMHIKESRQISLKYDVLMYAGIFLGPMACLLSGIGATLNPDAPTTFPIISACVAFVSGITVAITKYGKFEERSSHHKLAASKYTSLESNIRRQLSLCRTDRIHSVEYLEWVGNSFDDLFLASPLVAKNIYENYIKLAKEHGITIPDEYGITINVDSDYQQKKILELKDASVIGVNDGVEAGKTNSRISRTHSDIETFKGDNEIRRTQSMSHYPELNKFSDGRMEYEMQRMIGLK